MIGLPWWNKEAHVTKKEKGKLWTSLNDFKMRSQLTMRGMCARRILRDLVVHMTLFQRCQLEGEVRVWESTYEDHRGKKESLIPKRTVQYDCTDSIKIYTISFGSFALWRLATYETFPSPWRINGSQAFESSGGNFLSPAYISDWLLSELLQLVRMFPAIMPWHMTPPCWPWALVLVAKCST